MKTLIATVALLGLAGVSHAQTKAAIPSKVDTARARCAKLKDGKTKGACLRAAAKGEPVDVWLETLEDDDGQILLKRAPGEGGSTTPAPKAAKAKLSK